MKMGCYGKGLRIDEDVKRERKKRVWGNGVIKM